MPLTEPGWWYQEAATPFARALEPVAAVWGAIAEGRHRRGAAMQADVSVICVGNFTAGGTGKTPLSLLIAEEMERIGIRAAFLTRGYGGRTAGPHWVSPGIDSAADVGDEPLLLARACPTMVCRDRAEGARSIVATGAGHGAIIMDDGLQNGALAKDLTIAVVDARRGVGNGLVMPAGPLRAPLAFQLGLVDAVVVNERQGTKETDSRFTSWLRDHFGGPVLRAATRPDGETDWIREGPLIAYSGIGAPERFFGLVELLGGRIAEQYSFRDHHAFTAADAARLLRAAYHDGYKLCTTEKDWVRLPTTGVLGELRAASRVLKIRLELEERELVRLRSLLTTSLGTRRPSPRA